MNKLRILITATFTLSILLSIEGCAKKGCTYSNATNYDATAKEDDGSCVFSNTGNNADLTGQWLVKDTAEFYPINPGYTITISKNPSDTNKLIIFNLADVGQNVNATLTGTIFSIPSQTYPTSAASNTYIGSGVVVNQNTIRLLYNLNSYQFSGTATKK